MKVSFEWLKDYVRVNDGPDAVAHRLTMAGLETQRVLNGADPNHAVFETEVTTNRPDWLNHIGIAREVGALYHRKIRDLETQLSPKNFTGVASKERMAVRIKDAKRCPYYSCAV